MGPEVVALSRPALRASNAPATEGGTLRPAAAAPSPLSGELEARRFDQGYREGLDAGRRQGFAEGHADAQAQGREEGFAHGERQASAALHKELEVLRLAAEDAAHERSRRMDQLIGSVAAAFHERLARAEEDMLALCFEAVAVVFGELASRADGVRSLVQQVLSQSRQLGSGTVGLHPQDLALVGAGLGDFSRSNPDRKLQFVPDDRVELGGCVLSCAQGGLDARIETQFARLAQLIQHARGQQEGA